MRKIIYTRPDGGVSVVSVPFDTDEAIETARAKLPLDAISPKIVDESAIPMDRTFRNALKQNGAMLEYDMLKCRGLHRDRMRAVRKPKLEALDILWMRATARGDLTAASSVEAQREQLRNVTADPAIDAAQTPEELKSMWPAILNG